MAEVACKTNNHGAITKITMFQSHFFFFNNYFLLNNYFLFIPQQFKAIFFSHRSPKWFPDSSAQAGLLAGLAGAAKTEHLMI
jgi:hypothetical protein